MILSKAVLIAALIAALEARGNVVAWPELHLADDQAMLTKPLLDNFQLLQATCLARHPLNRSSSSSLAVPRGLRVETEARP
jgi:hypothetical protein